MGESGEGILTFYFSFQACSVFLHDSIIGILQRVTYLDALVYGMDFGGL